MNSNYVAKGSGSACAVKTMLHRAGFQPVPPHTALIDYYALTCRYLVSYYIVTERPAVTYVNASYISFVNFSSRRHGRGSPLYYVDLHLTTLVPFDNAMKLDFYFYEFLSNEYRRGFVEMHFKLCDLVHNDKFFGSALRQGRLQQPCPYPPGDIHLYNMSIPSVAIPPGFPFTKGRIYMNMTHGQDFVGSGHIDMELKEKLIRSADYKNKKSAMHNFFEN